MDTAKLATLIIGTCDEYSILLPGFFYLLYKHWPSLDCPIITTGSIKNCNYEFSILAGNDRGSFCTRLIRSIKASTTKYVFLCLDDFYFTKDVDIRFVNRAVEIMEKDQSIDHIDLHDTPTDEEYGEAPYDDMFVYKRRGVEYYCTTQFSLWRKPFLLKLLHRGESAWDFEILGSKRATHYGGEFLYRRDGFASAIDYPFGGVIHRGKVWSDAIEVIRESEVATGISLSDFPNKAKSQKKAPLLKRFYQKIYRRIDHLITWLPYWS